jgi:hypothetical protein
MIDVDAGKRNSGRHSLTRLVALESIRIESNDDLETLWIPIRTLPLKSIQFYETMDKDFLKLFRH